MKKRLNLSLHTLYCILFFWSISFSQIGEYRKFNAYDQKHFTIESDHFIVHYPKGLEASAHESIDILERLYKNYKNTYQVTLPSKTDIILSDDDDVSPFSVSSMNLVHMWVNDIDWNSRGTTNWLENVLAHEFAHVYSIWTSQKLPHWIPFLQAGFFNHPNLQNRTEAFMLFANEVLPFWFYEGVAQYESSRFPEADSWDSHRDMILRSAVMSKKLISWDKMNFVTGERFDDYEKTYNHGFSMIRYIANTYGYNAVVSMAREAARFTSINFDQAIQACIGIPGSKLHEEWALSMEKHYKAQIDSLGKQIYGRKISTDGYEVYWPKFSALDTAIYFLTNGKNELPVPALFRYSLKDSINDKERIKPVLGSVTRFYDIHEPTGKIVYSSKKSEKSISSSKKGGTRLRDLYIDTLPDPSKKQPFFSNPFTTSAETRISNQKSYYHAVFSPSAETLACVQHVKDQFHLLLISKTGKELKKIQLKTPDGVEVSIHSIYSLDWSPDGTYIALSFIDRNDRKIGLYTTATDEFHLLCDTPFDERDPRFSNDSKEIYFSSDRTGIANIYRINLQTDTLTLLTNVSGGAFAPDVSDDGKKLVFANYDDNGFGIYLIDSLKPLKQEHIPRDSMLKTAFKIQQQQNTVPLSLPKPYSPLPRQFLLVPTILYEQIVTDSKDAFLPAGVAKIGGVFNLVDPLSWKGMGTTLGGLCILDMKEFIFNKHEIINRYANYDLGFFGSTNLFPLSLSIQYMQRGVVQSDYVTFEKFGDTLVTDKVTFNINPHTADVTLGHRFDETSTMNVIAGYHWMNNYVKATVDPDMNQRFQPLLPLKGTRIGAYYSFTTLKPQIKQQISSNGIGFKVEYDLWNQRVINQVKFITYKNGFFEEVYLAPYRYHQLSTDLILSLQAPWYSKHDLFTQCNATTVSLTQWSKKKLKEDVDNGDITSSEMPSHLKPVSWLPGYSYYFKDSLKVIRIKKNSPLPPDTSKVYGDTIVFTGNTLISGTFSYRFPLYPKSFDTKIGFIYFDRLYGAFNVGGGVALNSLSNIQDLSRKQFLLYRGVELRLLAYYFNSFPLAMSLRWDYGMDKPSPVGGNKFSLRIGLNFDNWNIVMEPDDASLRSMRH